MEVGSYLGFLGIVHELAGADGSAIVVFMELFNVLGAPVQGEFSSHSSSEGKDTVLLNSALVFERQR